jgi:hypothetical protein
VALLLLAVGPALDGAGLAEAVGVPVLMAGVGDASAGARGGREWPAGGPRPCERSSSAARG